MRAYLLNTHYLLLLHYYLPFTTYLLMAICHLILTLSLFVVIFDLLPTTYYWLLTSHNYPILPAAIHVLLSVLSLYYFFFTARYFPSSLTSYYLISRAYRATF